MTTQRLYFYTYSSLKKVWGGKKGWFGGRGYTINPGRSMATIEEIQSSKCSFWSFFFNIYLKRSPVGMEQKKKNTQIKQC